LTPRGTPGGLPSGRDSQPPGTGCPRIYLHIGEPKTGTTFLQDALWDNRAWLAAQGVLLPGYRRRDHSRASRDLRGAPREAADPAEPWVGEWDILAGQALCARKAAVVSDELLAACTAEQADRAVQSLLPAEVHIILTVRDFATLLPAEWQERVKCRDTVRWEDWLERIIGIEPATDRRSRSWFWNVHDTLAILSAWSQHISPDRVHVITMPRPGAAQTLWVRFASVLGIDPSGANLSGARPNSSLGLAEAEFLRRMNGALPKDVPDWFYTRNIKRVLALDVLLARPRQARLALPPGHEAWARDQAKSLVAALHDAKYHLVGDLSELLPPPAARPAAQPAGQSADQLLDAAVQAAAALAEHHYREMYPPRRPRLGPGSPGQAAARLAWKMLNGPRLNRALCSASHHAAVRHLRVLIWRVLVRPARHQA
jgi:hypothetical protein